MDLIFYIYIAFLVFGGIIASASIIGGGDDSGQDSHGGLGGHETGGHLGGGSGISTGHELSSSGHLEVTHIDSHPVDFDGDSHPDAIQHHLSEETDAVKFVSIRNFTYFSTLFGLSGTIFTLIGIVPVLTFLISAGLGTFAAYAGFRTVKYLKNSETGEAVDVFNLKGRVGKVILPASKQKKGKIRMEVSGNTIDLIIKVSDVSEKEEFSPGEDALVLDIKDNTVYIIPVDF